VKPRPLPARFYSRDTRLVARDLLGRDLISTIGGRRCVVRIVETEAYLGPHDPASHAAGGHRSRRNESMYGPPGLAYVYFTYGMHWCLNVVTERAGFPAAVLLRAGEPVLGLGTMRRRRRIESPVLLASGPARLTQALGITRALDGHRLTRPPLWIAAGEPVPKLRLAESPRIGIRRAAGWRLRFYERGNPCVSGR
jgi:DNA-3-methyladenine glycosylase